MNMIALKNMGVKAGQLFTLLFCSLSIASCATTDDDWQPVSALSPDADFAVYIARIDSMNYVGSPPCPKNHICMNSFFDLQLTPDEVIAGNPDIGTQTYRVIQHSPFRDGLALMVHAKREQGGKWALVQRRIVSVAGCLDSDLTRALEAIENSDSDWNAEEGEEGQTCLSRLLQTD